MAGSYNAVPPPGLGDGGGPVSVLDLIRAAKERAAQVTAGLPTPHAEPALSSSSDGQFKRHRDDDDDDDNGEPDSKRQSMPWVGTGANAAQLGSGGSHMGIGAVQDQENMDVPNQVVGLVIGKGGDSIKRIQAVSGARVQIAPESTDGITRRVTLMGDARCIEAAKKLIQEIMVEHGQDGSAGSGHLRIEVQCPASKVGSIIGRGGEKIRELQQRSGAHIKVIQDGAHQLAPVKPIVIMGEEAKVEIAKALVEEIINEQPPPPPPSHSYTPSVSSTSENANNTPLNSSSLMEAMGITRTEIAVPPSCVGLIIGQGGQTIKSMQQRTGARIQLQPDSGGSERMVFLEGSAQAVSAAQKEIDTLLEEAKSRSMGGGGSSHEPPRRPAGETVKVPVPAAKVGLVIGRGGETIRQIQAETGAYIQLERDTPPGPNKFFVVEGTSEQLENAKRQILDRVADRPPAPGGYPHQGGGWGMAPGMAAWGAPAWGAAAYGQAGYGVPPAAAWGMPSAAQPAAAQAYGGYGMYPGSAAVGGTPSADGASAPGTAPAPPADDPSYSAQPTGQTDQQPQQEMTEQQRIWAKQWEEYYAKMGYSQAQGGAQPAPPQ